MLDFKHKLCSHTHKMHTPFPSATLLPNLSAHSKVSLHMYTNRITLSHLHVPMHVSTRNPTSVRAITVLFYLSEISTCSCVFDK